MLFYIYSAITSGTENAFVRGMIVMHSGVTAIPSGWAVCDGGEYEFNGVVTQTPNLINKFIKAVGTSAEVQAVNNSDLNESNDLGYDEYYDQVDYNENQSSGILGAEDNPYYNTY